MASSDQLHAVYVPHANDAGQQVRLQLTAYGSGSCNDAISQDIFLLDVIPLPAIQVGESLATCVTEGIEIPEGHVQVGFGQNINWKISDASGAGTIMNPHSLTPIYIPHATDAGKTITLEITAEGISACATNTTTETLDIKVGAKPFVWFSVIDNQADSTRCQNATVYFKDVVNFGVAYPHPDQSITRRIWEFKNTAGYHETHETVNETIIGHQFSESGIFEVTLTIETMVGNTVVCSSSSTTHITIHAAPVADFLTHSLSNCDNKVQFEDASTTQLNSIVSWLWDFGVGFYSTIPDPLYEYTTAGPKTASLTIKDQRGCINTVSKDFLIDESFDFAIGYEPFCFGAETELMVTPGSIVPENNTIAAYKWVYSHTVDASFTPSAAQIFPQPGLYQVSLEATDETGCVKTKSIAVDVPEPLTPEFSFDGCELSVGFILNQEMNKGVVTEWQWDFGDSNTQVFYDTHPDVVYHTYQENGTYIVTLRVFDKIGCEGEFLATEVKTMCVDYVGYFVPNAFSPDHTSQDVKVFKPKGISIGEYHIRVLDLWGNVVWESTALEDGSPSESWDGTFNREPMPQGVYVWSAYVRFLDGTIWKGNENGSTTGSVTLIR
jgi:PKD repeat protein